MPIRRILTVIALSCAALLTPMAASSASAVKKRGSGEDGWCNKDFREGSAIRFKLCFLDVPTGVYGDCGPLTRSLES